MNRIDQELILAAAENNLPEVCRHLSVGADVNAKNSHGDTPLHKASYEGNVQVVKELREHGANTEVKDCNGRTPLHLTCYWGHLAVVNELLSPNDSNDTTTILGKRKSRGADIQAKDCDGNTPLHFASIRGHLPVVKALVSGGANILAGNACGGVPIHYAVNERKSEVAKYLLKQLYATTRRFPLHDLVEDLTWIGNPISWDAPPLRAALHMHVLGTDDVVEIIEYLVDQNPELVSSRDQNGSLPLHVACHRGAPFAIVQSLVNRYKASAKSVTPQGDLPLFLACEMFQTSLDTIFLLMKLYPDLVYRRSLDNRCWGRCSF
jgi:ankyrin repeat protein